MRRALANVAAVAILVASTNAHATLAAAPTSIIGVVDNTDAIASCSLSIDTGAKMVTPLVTLQPPARTTPTDIRFALLDANGAQIGTQDVSVPPPSFGPALTPFPLPGPIAAAHCNLKPADSPPNGASSAPAAAGGGGGSGALLVIGGLAVVGVIAVAAGSHGGGSTASSAPVSTPTFPQNTPSPTHATPTPTPRVTATPVSKPTATPTATPVSKPTATPTATATAVATATPTPTATPAPGSLVLTPSSLAFTSEGASYAMTSTASETGYTGTFAASGSTCGGIATISGPSGGTFTVTPQGAGTCAFTISDSHGGSAQLSITVTIASGTIEARKAQGPHPKPHS